MVSSGLLLICVGYNYDPTSFRRAFDDLSKAIIFNFIRCYYGHGDVAR